MKQMGNVYKIGKFRFYTYEEYQKGLEDVRKIQYIAKEVDMNDPDAIVRLYTSIRQGKIRFQTEIGEDYLLKLSDIVADNTRKNGGPQVIWTTGESEQEKNVPKKEKEKTQSKASVWRTRLGIVCLILAGVSFAIFAREEYRDNKAARDLKMLQEEHKNNTRNNENTTKTNTTAEESKKNVAKTQKDKDSKKNADNNNVTSDIAEKKALQDREKERSKRLAGLQVLPEYQSFLEQNPNFCGWITVDGTDIDYPVVQSSTDNNFYLHHNFLDEEDENGSIFLEKETDYVLRDTNIIVYGHNMKNGLMFGELKRYLKEGYLEDHPTIQFDTLYEKGTYQIEAVCLAKVEYQGEDAFRYYTVRNLDSKNAFQTYLSNIQKLSVFDKKVDIVYGDQLLTLSTCNSYTEDGRLFLVAKKTG